MVGFADDQRARRSGAGPLDERPDLAASVAETRERAEVLGIAQRQRRSVVRLRLSRERRPARSCRAVEADSCMAVIAERLRVRRAAATQRVDPVRVERSSLHPVPRDTLAVGSNHLNGERHASRDEIRTVLRDHHLVLAHELFSTIRSFSTAPNVPGTPPALMPATFLSVSLSTTPSSVMWPLFTMISIG